MSPAGSALANGLGWLVPILAYYGALPLIIKGVGSEKYGLIVFAITLVGYVGFASPPVSAGAVRFLAVAYGRGDQAAFVRSAIAGGILGVAFASFGAAVVCVASPYLASHVFAISKALIPEATIVLWLTAGGFFVNSLLGAAASVPASIQRYGIINISTAGGQAFGLALGAYAALRSGSAAAVVLGQIVGNTLALIALLAFDVRTIYRMSAGREDSGRWHNGIRELFSFSGILWLSQACSIISLQTDKLIVGLTTGPTSLTWYSIPAKAGEQLATITGRLTMSLYPLTGTRQSNGETRRILPVYDAFLRLSLVLSLIAATLAWTHGLQVLRLWLRVPVPATTAPILAAAAVAGLFRSCGTIAYHAANGMGRPEVSLRLGVAAAVLSPALVFAGSLLRGAIGAALGFMVATALVCVAFDAIVRMRLIGCGGITSWADVYIRTAAAGVAVPLCLWGAEAAGQGPLATLGKALAEIVVVSAVASLVGLLRISDIRLLMYREKDSTDTVTLSLRPVTDVPKV